MRRPQFTATRAIAVAAATTVLAGGAVAVAAATTADPTPEASPSAPSVAPEDDAKKGKKGHATGLGLGMGMGSFDADQLSKMIDRLPEAMRTDLAEALTADSAARPALLEDMKKKAETGAYGEDVKKQLESAEKFGKQFAQRGQKARAEVPQELKDDLAALRGLPKDERKAALEQIRKDAEAGKYGDKVRDQAKMLGGFAHGFGHGGKPGADDDRS